MSSPGRSVVVAYEDGVGLGRSAAGPSTAGPSATGPSAVGRPATGHSAASHSAADRPAAGHSTADRPAAGRSAVGPEPVHVKGGGAPWLAATLPALELAAGAVQALRRAAGRAGATGAVVDDPLDLALIAAAYSSERVLRLDGHEVTAFAPLSGFFHAVDGWVRTHANYPHHEHRLLAALGLLGVRRQYVGLTGELRGVGPDELASTLRELTAQEIEDRVQQAGGLAVRLRTEDEWRASPQGIAAAEGPLVRVRERGEPLTNRWGWRPGDVPEPGRPLAGLRVLDLTRVVAGPVATRALALLGASVLRIDPPVPAEIRWQHLDTGQGKRTALLDLHDDGDRARAQLLLDEADVLVTGYRPGAIESFGLEVQENLVHARISAWGERGPWAGRRGFDSIVQAATGISIVESRGGEARERSVPGALPAQVLDHATGYLLAAGIVDALVARAQDGLGRTVVASLARTATWLLDAPGRDPQHPPPAALPRRVAVSHGRHPEVTTARPPLPGYDDYPYPAAAWGTNHAHW